MMTRKDFVSIAKILSDERVNKKVCERVADFLSEQNPRFDRERFLKACY